MQPRGRKPFVEIDEDTYAALKWAQELLDQDIVLILTRGKESQRRLNVVCRRFFRKCGGALFSFCYPTRKSERCEIFSANGHDHIGDCVDISIQKNGEKLSFLPLSVFTPLWYISRIEEKHADTLSEVRNALDKAGLRVHLNRVEALQIHCERVKNIKPYCA